MVQAHVMYYRAVLQTVLLYGSKSWMVTGVMLNFLEGFYHQAAWRISGITAQHTEDGEWD